MFSRRLVPTIIVVLFSLSLFSFASSAVFAANPLQELCEQNPTAQVCIEDTETRGESTTDSRIFRFVGQTINILLLVLGIASVFAVIVGGVLYVTSTGDPQKVNKARNTILYALIGVVIASLGRVIVLYALDNLSGVL